MKDDTAIRFRRYMVYLLVIVLWTVFLVSATAFFRAVHETKEYFQVP
jgi:peptidoglycan biosynthesis protein MviN/MurJ (putative lipid II flippase)